ncbi:MAG: protein kinase, partial [Planctomycetales bacterium]|nr:protein kinase [Planctomycetales bacterium]
MRDRRSDRDPTEAETTPFSVEPSKIALAGTRLQSEKCEYAFISPLGAGGSGTVFRAINIADGAQVAIKILHAQQPLAEDLTRFAREARILREIDHPNIIRFLDYGKHDAYHFIVTELAEGGSLAPAIASDQCLDEMTALRVLKQIALALVAPHEQGIVHRDLKPANILLTDAHRWKLGIPGTIKVADFGLARPVRSDGSVRVTKSGAMLGTPAYMAPEQGLTTDVTPAADVYALGAILFRLLVGRIPFDDIDPINLIMRHRHERPPRVADLAEVSPATSALVATALEKTPARRYPDSRTLLEAVTQILSGTAKNIEQHPRSFVPVNSNLQCFEFQWQLECSPTELWPYVSNTDRLNEAANLPSVEFVHESDDHGQIKTFGQFRLFGLPIRWEEHPFEWIEGKRLAVERTFSEGPFRLLISEVELEPLEGTGTSLVHRITVDPRGIVGRATASFEIGVKAKSALTRVYRHIDEWAAQRIDHCEDPFRSQPARRQQARPIKQHLDNLRNRHPSRTSVIQLLEKYLTRSSPQELAAIRPLVVAKRLGLKVNDVLDTFLALTSDGLLGRSWDIICPKCRVRSECHPSLADVAAHANCVACGRQYDVDFAQSVELLFRQI